MVMKQVVAAVLGGFFVCSPAMANSVCAKRNDLVSALVQQYGESLIGQGLAADGRLVELFVSARGSFTIIVTAPSGISCLLSVGENWEIVAKPASDLPDFQRRMR